MRDGLQQVIDTNKRIAERSVGVADEAAGATQARGTANQGPRAPNLWRSWTTLTGRPRRGACWRQSGDWLPSMARPPMQSGSFAVPRRRYDDFRRHAPPNP